MTLPTDLSADLPTDLPTGIAGLTVEQRELLAMRLRRAGRAERPTPLSFTQEQLWFLDRLEPGTPVYNVPFALRLTGSLDVAALGEAVNAVVARHAALRTVFVDSGGELRQVVKPRLRVPLPVTDLSRIAQPLRREEIERVTGSHAAHSFALDSGPLLAVRLLTLAAADHLLLVTVHHIVFDAWSADVFTADLVAYYGEIAGGEPARLPALTVQFPEYAERTRRPAAEAETAAHLAYWRQALAAAPVVSTVPPDLPRPPVQTHRGGRRTVSLPAGLTDQLAELARGSGVTLNAVVLAGVAALLRQATGQDDVLLGTPAAGRSSTELERLVGCFANMLVLRVDLAGAPTVRELIGRTHRTISAAYAHQEAPYARVVEEVAPPRDPSMNPLFQVMVTMAGAAGESRPAAGVTFTPEPVDNGLTDFDLFLSVGRRGREIEFVVDYNADLYLGETADLLADRLPVLLAALAGNPDAGIDALDATRLRRVAVAATFTVDPVRGPLDWRRTATKACHCRRLSTRYGCRATGPGRCSSACSTSSTCPKRYPTCRASRSNRSRWLPPESTSTCSSAWSGRATHCGPSWPTGPACSPPTPRPACWIGSPACSTAPSPGPTGRSARPARSARPSHPGLPRHAMSSGSRSLPPSRSMGWNPSSSCGPDCSGPRWRSGSRPRGRFCARCWTGADHWVPIRTG
jgi:hypothetical protein